MWPHFNWATYVWCVSIKDWGGGNTEYLSMISSNNTYRIEDDIGIKVEIKRNGFKSYATKKVSEEKGLSGTGKKDQLKKKLEAACLQERLLQVSS